MRRRVVDSGEKPHRVDAEFANDGDEDLERWLRVIGVRRQAERVRADAEAIGVAVDGLSEVVREELANAGRDGGEVDVASG